MQITKYPLAIGLLKCDKHNGGSAALLELGPLVLDQDSDETSAHFPCFVF